GVTRAWAERRAATQPAPRPGKSGTAKGHARRRRDPRPDRRTGADSGAWRSDLRRSDGGYAAQQGCDQADSHDNGLHAEENSRLAPRVTADQRPSPESPRRVMQVLMARAISRPSASVTSHSVSPIVRPAFTP